jgi:general secretion pathway protein G
VEKHHSRSDEGSAAMLMAAILAMLMVTVLGGMIAWWFHLSAKEKRRSELANWKFANSEMSMLATSLEQYRIDQGEFPSEQQGLMALYYAPFDLAKWNGPYLSKPVLVDVWGNSLQYEIGGNSFSLRSLGPDGLLRTADDILVQSNNEQ